MPSISPIRYQAVLDEHRLRLARVVDQRGARAMKRLYDAAAADLVQRLARLAPGRGQGFDAYHKRLVLAQLRQGQVQLARRMFGELGDLSREAQIDAVRGLDSVIARLERDYSGHTPVLPSADAARFAGIIDSKRTSLLREFPQGTENRIRAQGTQKVAARMGMRQRHAASVGNLATRTIQECEKQLALSTLLDEPASQSIDRISGVIDSQWSDAERIVRTEGAWAQNASAREAIDAAGEVLPSLRARWSEHVDEATLEPLDDRVAIDSIAIHGQVAEPGGLFTMPATSPRGTLKEPDKLAVPERLVGRQWDHPPDRPNGRECLAPWRPEWGIPGWRFVGGARVPL